MKGEPRVIQKLCRRPHGSGPTHRLEKSRLRPGHEKLFHHVKGRGDSYIVIKYDRRGKGPAPDSSVVSRNIPVPLGRAESGIAGRREACTTFEKPLPLGIVTGPDYHRNKVDAESRVERRGEVHILAGVSIVI